jgi:hypothetical protein
MQMLNYIALAAGLALLIMSGIIRGSAGRLPDSTQKRDISRTSNILLMISLIMVGVTGFNVYSSMKAAAPVASTAFAYYF